MKRTVRLSLGMSCIMLVLVLIAPQLASPKLELRFLPKDVCEAGKDHPRDGRSEQYMAQCPCKKVEDAAVDSVFHTDFCDYRWGVLGNKRSELIQKDYEKEVNRYILPVRPYSSALFISERKYKKECSKERKQSWEDTLAFLRAW